MHTWRSGTMTRESAYADLMAWAATPAAYSRLASLAAVRGDNEQAIRLMERAARLASDSGDYGEGLAGTRTNSES